MVAAVGDRVQYVPGEEFALQKDPRTGNYPWVLGWVTNPQGKVEELEPNRAELQLRSMRLHPDPEREKKRLRLIRPATTWPAIVRTQNEDGTADLDVESNQGGVTLHLSRVPYDPSGSRPSSWR